MVTLELLVKTPLHVQLVTAVAQLAKHARIPAHRHRTASATIRPEFATVVRALVALTAR